MSQPPNSYVGRQLGTYRIIRQLGTGGFAEVYLGKHVQTNWDVAVKILKINYSDTTFRQEAETLWKLNHPHIVKIMGYDIENGISYLVMEYAAKGSLRDLHPQGDTLLQPLILDYVKQIAGGLAYMHKEHLVHCDIKPQNFLVRASGAVILGDFGIATEAMTTSLRLASLPSSPKPIVGTLHYIAPEQWQGQNPTPATDQYALGVVVYEWLSGRRPFAGTHPQMIAQAHMYNPPPPFNDNTISAELEDAVIRALAKDPADRFPSILDFAQALEDAIQNRPLFASQQGPNQGPPPPPLGGGIWGQLQPQSSYAPPSPGGIYNTSTVPVTPQQMGPQMYQTTSNAFPGTNPRKKQSSKPRIFDRHNLLDHGNRPFLMISGIFDLLCIILLFLWLGDLNLALGLPIVAIVLQLLCAATFRREIAQRFAWILTAYETLIIFALMLHFVSTAFYILGLIIAIGAWLWNDVFYARNK